MFLTSAATATKQSQYFVTRAAAAVMSRTSTSSSSRLACAVVPNCHYNPILLCSSSLSLSSRSISYTRSVYNNVNSNSNNLQEEDESVPNEAELALEKVPVQVSKEVQDIVDQILKLDVVELGMLSNLFAERLGFDQIDMMAAGSAAAMGEDEEGEEGTDVTPKEEKTAFELKLTGFDAKSKIKVIKEVRTITGLGLKEAKALVEGAPTTLKKDIKKEEAEELKAKMEAVGATLEIE